MVDTARRPADLDAVDLRGRAQAEMQAGVACRLVASPAEARGDPGLSPPMNGHDGADGVAVRGRTLQAQGEEMAGIGPVVEQGEGFVLRDDEDVGAAVVIE